MQGILIHVRESSAQSVKKELSRKFRKFESFLKSFFGRHASQGLDVNPVIRPFFDVLDTHECIITTRAGKVRKVVELKSANRPRNHPKSGRAFNLIPEFEKEKEERDLWRSRDSTEHIDWKLLAKKRDIPCQFLVKVFLSDRIEEELAEKGHKKSLHRIAKKAGSR
ncbi:MAG TPA: hypothetical protein VLL97_00170 [Acidobacteriota bacterium]|nr:hypothetical protein [Acidobacteriota bacterium]